MSTENTTPDAITVDLAVSGMTCASCVARVEKRLARVPGATATASRPPPRPSGTPLISALSRVTKMLAGSISDAIVLAFGHSAIAAKASRPVPVPISATLRAVTPRAFMAESMARHPAVVACWPVPKAWLAGITRSRAAGSAGCSGVRTWKRPARIGSSPFWLSVTQSASGRRWASKAGGSPANSALSAARSAALGLRGR